MKKKDDNAPTDVVEDVQIDKNSNNSAMQRNIEHHQDPKIVGSGRTKQLILFW